MKILLAFASGLLAGGFLYRLFGFDDKNVQLYGWQWYQAAVLLIAVGLDGVFPEAWQNAAITLGLGTAPTLIFCYEIVYLRPAESMWPVVLPMVFLLSLPAPLIGCAISGLVKRARLPRAIYAGALMAAIVIGVLLPNLTNPRRQRLETEKVPSLLKQIYEAEMIYSAQQPEGNVVCDGTLLPGTVGKLGWQGENSAAIKKYLRVGYYNISLDCPNEVKPRGFRVNAISNDGYILAPRLSIDETGKLVVEPATKGANTSRYAR